MGKLSGITLTVTERCNLRCSYCHARRSSRSMSREVAEAAVDLLLDNSEGVPLLSLSFYGGEPFLERELLDRIVTRLRAGAEPPQQVRCVTPTNGIGLDDDTLAFCRERDIELAISIDGTHGSVQRPYPNGRDATPALIARLPQVLAAGRPLARMTVTPRNVGHLAANVKALARLGFEQIVYQPAWELEWTEHAVRMWAREHERIVTWFSGARAAGLTVPELPALDAIEARLLRGKERAPCGAGNEFVAVDVEGNVYPCYRFVFAPDSACRLGDVQAGLTATETLSTFAALPRQTLRPEQGSCETCASRDGCIHYCPALGHLMLGDLRGVPAVVCAMMQAQVEAVRRGLGVGERTPRRTATPGWAVAIVAATSALAACGGNTGGDDEVRRDAGVSGAGAELTGGTTAGGTGGFVGGICAELTGGTTAGGTGGMVGGLCPVELTGGTTSGGTGGTTSGETGGTTSGGTGGFVGGICAELIGGTPAGGEPPTGGFVGGLC